MKLQILYHGNCFDGVVSSAIFTRFYLDQIHPGAEVAYRGMAHGPRDPFGPDHDATFHADDNAVLDFRYSPSPRLTWWCDHHHSAFLTAEHRELFEARRNPRHHFDPSAPSCAGLLCRWLAREHGLDAAPFDDHVRWADLIDAARFDSPAQAVELAEPALQLMILLESAPPAELVLTLIRGLVSGTVDQVHQLSEVRAAIAPALAAHRETVELFRARMVLRAGVALVDLGDDPVDGFNKFIPYFLAGGVQYTVVVTDSARRAKVSVGSNPWQRPEPLVNIAELCGRHGGGGHPVVGAVSLPPGSLERAREIARDIVQALGG